MKISLSDGEGLGGLLCGLLTSVILWDRLRFSTGAWVPRRAGIHAGVEA
jgi:hypothetical protein